MCNTSGRMSVLGVGMMSRFVTGNGLVSDDGAVGGIRV